MSERCLEGVERCRGKVKTISGKVRSGQVQSRRLNAVAYTLPCGVHMYASLYTLCPVQCLAR